MDWTIEFAPDALADLRRIFRHLVDSHHRDFDRPLRDARQRANRRIGDIRTNTLRIAAAPFIGTTHAHAHRIYRHLTLDRAIYWFTLDETTRIVRIEAIFFGGQDHIARMSERLAKKAEGDG